MYSKDSGALKANKIVVNNDMKSLETYITYTIYIYGCVDVFGMARPSDMSVHTSANNK